jgi:hypothetical protein
LIASEKIGSFSDANLQFVLMNKVVMCMIIVWFIDYIADWTFYFINAYKERKWLRGLKK